MTKQNHPFHLVTQRPWPIIISINLFNNLICIIRWFHNLNYLIILTIPCTLLCIYQWWRDVIRESTFQGCHTPLVYKGIFKSIKYMKWFFSDAVGNRVPLSISQPSILHFREFWAYKCFKVEALACGECQAWSSTYRQSLYWTRASFDKKIVFF